MPTDTHLQRVSLATIRSAAETCPAPAAFGAALLRALGTAVPNDGMHLWTVDPATRLLSRLVASTELNPAHRIAWLRNHYLTEIDDLVPYFSTRKMMLAGISGFAVAADQHAVLGVPKGIQADVPARIHTRLFHDGGSPTGGFSHIPLLSGGTTVGLLTLIFRGQAPFIAVGQFAFLTRHRGYFGKLLAAAIAREVALHTGGHTASSGASGIVIVGPDGNVRFASPSGEAWADRFSNLESARSGDLPTPLLSVLAARRTSVQQSDHSGVVSLVTTLGNEQVRVEASAADAEGGTAIVISSLVQPAAPEIPAGWPLTRAERLVAEQVMYGKSNREIASVLFLSEPTIETHMRHIFAKLGLRRRTELVGLIFRASLPAMPDQ